MVDPRPDFMNIRTPKHDECPKCYHVMITPIKYSWWRKKMKWKCLECKYEWYRLLIIDR